MSKLDSLLSLISQKKEAQVEITHDDLFSLVAAEEPIEYKESEQSKNFPLPDRDLFLSIFIPYLRDPYWFNVQNFREYKKWLLGDSCYVLNSFKSLDIEILLKLYLENNPPARVGGLHLLALFLWEIDLCVPESYQVEFEKVIKESRDIKQKNSA